MHQLLRELNISAAKMAGIDNTISLVKHTSPEGKLKALCMRITFEGKPEPKIMYQVHNYEGLTVINTEDPQKAFDSYNAIKPKKAVPNDVLV